MGYYPSTGEDGFELRLYFYICRIHFPLVERIIIYQRPQEPQLGSWISCLGCLSHSHIYCSKKKWVRGMFQTVCLGSGLRRLSHLFYFFKFFTMNTRHECLLYRQCTGALPTSMWSLWGLRLWSVHCYFLRLVWVCRMVVGEGSSWGW